MKAITFPESCVGDNMVLEELLVIDSNIMKVDTGVLCMVELRIQVYGINILFKQRIKLSTISKKFDKGNFKPSVGHKGLNNAAGH